MTLPALAGRHRKYRQQDQVFRGIQSCAIPPPCHPVNRWFGSGQDCDIVSEPYFCFDHSRMELGSGSILVVSFGDLAAYNNLCWDSFHLLGVYEEASNPYFI